ncbi:MAG: hypothetical protein QM652_01290 [Legionella sp.]|uniref:hypothetical protein n=1 Tax=Legionella sp. TaxID=459 RepID=UPI0039E62D50
MINYKSVKWCAGAALALGLTSCSLWNTPRSNYVDMHYQHHKPQSQEVVVNKKKVVQKTYASKDPTQKATPGPVRKAAPQLPVIQ